jgi:plastocyanin
MIRFLSIALVATAMVALAACSAASSAGTVAPSADANAIQISANNLKFSTATLSAPAGKSFQIQFTNQEAAPHNVAIYKDQSASQKVFGQDPSGGPKTVVYQVGPLAAGSYFFRCDVHPDMKGTLTVG